MGRFGTLFLIWLIGFALGSIGYLIYPVLSQAFASLAPAFLQLNEQIRGALLAGFLSSIVTVLAVYIWSYATSRREAYHF
jgi:uncharacterized membrane protein